MVRSFARMALPALLLALAACRDDVTSPAVQRPGGKWNVVGTWTFTPGWNKVQISRWTTTGYIVVGDAIRVQ